MLIDGPSKRFRIKIIYKRVTNISHGRKSSKNYERVHIQHTSVHRIHMDERDFPKNIRSDQFTPMYMEFGKHRVVENVGNYENRTSIIITCIKYVKQTKYEKIRTKIREEI